MKHTIPREHFNLYYIFSEDKNKHPPPPEALAKLKEKITQHISKAP